MAVAEKPCRDRAVKKKIICLLNTVEERGAECLINIWLRFYLLFLPGKPAKVAFSDANKLSCARLL
jgi:hypothetical protein